MWTKINKCMLHKWLCWSIGVWLMSVLIASVHLDRSVENDIVHAWVQQTTVLQTMIRSSYRVRKIRERTFSLRSCSKFRHTPPASWVSMKPKCFHNKTFPDSSSPLAGFSTLERKARRLLSAEGLTPSWTFSLSPVPFWGANVYILKILHDSGGTGSL